MNIIKCLQKEIDAGRIYVGVNGETLTEEKLSALMRKEYSAKVAAGTLPDDLTFADYLSAEADKLPMVVDVLAGVIEWLNPSNDEAEEPAAEPEPAEVDEPAEE